MKDLTTGKISSQIIRFALPILLGQIFNLMYNIVDGIVVGNYLGKGALSVVGASFPIVFAFFALVMGITQGITVVISQYFGAKQMDKTKESIFTMYVIVVISSVILSIAGVLASESMFRLIDLPEELIPDACIYLNIIMLGAIASFALSATSNILRGIGDSKTPLYFNIIASLLNVVLDLFFVIVFQWGIAGAAIATVLAQLIVLIVACIYLAKNHQFLKGDLSEFKFNIDIFKKSIKIGLPTGFQQFFVAVGTMALYQIVNKYDTVVIDAFSAAARVDAFAITPAICFTSALGIFVGQNIGANKLDRVKKGLISTILITSIISVVFSALMFVFGKALIRLFSPIPQVIDIGYEYLLIVSAFYVVFSLMFCFTSVLRGAGDTLIPMFFTLLSLWFIRIPISWYLSNKIGYTGIWWGIPLAWSVGLLLSAIYYFTYAWKKKHIVGDSGKLRVEN